MSNIMFLWPNSSELNNYSILSKLWYLSDYALLVVDIQIIKKVIPDVQYTIIKNSEEESNFTSDIIENFKKINTLQLTSKEFLEITV